MRIQLILPNKTLVDEETEKITAPGRDGDFQILPKHIDATWSLRPGILTIYQNEKARYFAINEGFLVKRGDRVHLACLQAVEGASLQSLEKDLKESFLKLDDLERKARKALARMEVDAMKRFVEIEK